MGLWSKKKLSDLQADSEILRRHMRLTHLILFGVGGTVGAGIFVLTGTVAANYAGPGVAFSFVLAGVACLCAALCYAELASMIPVSGSAYTYAFATMGEFVAWVIGWNLILEYLFATSTIAVGWSGYFTAYIAELGFPIPAIWSSPPVVMPAAQAAGTLPGFLNLPAVAVILAIAFVLALGIRESTRINVVLVAVKLVVIGLVIGFGAVYVRPENWVPFVPANEGVFGEFGWSGVVRAAGVVFYAYVGFDMISSASQEAVNPKRDIPLSLLATLAICSVLYIAMSLVMTGLASYKLLDVPHPVFVAIGQAPQLGWLKVVVNIGAIIGLCSAMMMTIYGQTRIFYCMGCDRLLPGVFAAVNPRTRTPVIGTTIVGVAAALVAGLLPITLLGELVSIGTLLAFAIVCAGVVVLRFTSRDHPRGFRAPWLLVTAPIGIAACLYMMVSLPIDTWLRFAAWMVAGLLVYMFYSRHHSIVSNPADSADLEGAERSE